MPGRTLLFHCAVFARPTTNSFDLSDCSVLTELVNGIAPDWSVEIYRDPVGEVSVLINPPDVNDACGPTLIIYKSASVFHLDQFRWDKYSSLGDYLHLDDVSDAVRGVLLSQPVLARTSTTLH